MAHVIVRDFTKDFIGQSVYVLKVGWRSEAASGKSVAEIINSSNGRYIGYVCIG
jgi:hypothetical protein